MNVYLFEKNVSALMIQKHNRELELIVQECILAAVRESIPTEAIIRAYLDESVEQEEEVIIEPVNEPNIENSAAAASQNTVTEHSEEKEDTEKPQEIPPEEPPPSLVPAIKDLDTKPVITRLAFNDVDEAYGGNNEREEIIAPKNIERLEEISSSRNLQRKFEEEGMDDSDDDMELERIRINDEPLDMSELGITDLDGGNREDELKLDFEEIM
jgi:hypothetical protein